VKFSWIFNGTLEAHHLAASYLAVWLIQGGYAAWIGWHWMHTKRPSSAAEPGLFTSEDDS
jgi:hypothetical protein